MENKYVFFWKSKSPFSNWHPSVFEVDGVIFQNVEQYMMYHKALFFKDNRATEEIMKTSNPRDIKAWGRKVRGFNARAWDSVKFQIVYDACLAKFSQNDDLKEVLLKTGDKKLVEASPFDKIWGIALSEEEAKKVPESEWPGENLLGKVLMKVRETLNNS